MSSEFAGFETSLRSDAAAPLRVLVVDDSAVVRQILLKILSSDPTFAVETAADPLIAKRKIQRRRPDVIVLDLELPHMDGLTFLAQVMESDPIPVIICSGHAGPGTETALEALSAGAVNIIAKPQIGVAGFLESDSIRLIRVVRDAASVKLCARPPRTIAPRPVVPVPIARPSNQTALTAIGASTGGPEAISRIVSQWPEDGPPLLIVQHMPAEFTPTFARRLDRLSAAEVVEAQDGDKVERGRVLLAPGGRHMMLVRTGSRLSVVTNEGPEVSGHRPSVDVLFHSVARTLRARAVGVLLTGMGSDGANGLAELKRAGARTIAQDEASSVVYGMPRKAAEMRAAMEILGIDRIPKAILDPDSRTQRLAP